MKPALILLACAVLVPSAALASTTALAKPSERCTTANRGVVKWIKDEEFNKWAKWRCECNLGAITVCRWKLKAVTPRPYVRVQLPNGDWFTPEGWHRHRHFVYAPMTTGGYCGHFWTTWHYLPARLRG